MSLLSSEHSSLMRSISFIISLSLVPIDQVPLSIFRKVMYRRRKVHQAESHYLPSNSLKSSSEGLAALSSWSPSSAPRKISFAIPCIHSIRGEALVRFRQEIEQCCRCWVRYNMWPTFFFPCRLTIFSSTLSVTTNLIHRIGGDHCTK